MLSPAADPQRDHRWAWGFVVLLVAGGVLGQLIGYGLALLIGLEASEENPPSLAQALLITLPTLAVSIAPGVGALVFGIRAGRGGQIGGYVAATVGGLAIAFWAFVSAVVLGSSI